MLGAFTHGIYCLEHMKIKFVSMCGHVLGSAMGENSELPVVTEGDEQGKININM